VVLFIFGGEILRGFSFALIVGILAVTYSSLFIASPILIDTIKNKTEPAPVTGKVMPERVRTV
jgi:SecD/SecF fusion protein